MGEEKLVEVQDSRKITHHLEEIIEYTSNYGDKPDNVNMYPLGLGNTRISADSAQKSLRTLYGLRVTRVLSRLVIMESRFTMPEEFAKTINLSNDSKCE